MQTATYGKTREGHSLTLRICRLGMLYSSNKEERYSMHQLGKISPTSTTQVNLTPILCYHVKIKVTHDMNPTRISSECGSNDIIRSCRLKWQNS